jgi:hypothetical protein
MGIIAPSHVKVHPSYVIPELILQYQQASGAFNILPGEEPMVRLGEGDMYVYVNKVDIRTKTAAGQSNYNVLPGADIAMSYVSTPTYLIRTQANYDHHDVAAASSWNVSLPEAQRLGMRQGIFQQLRNALLYGFNPANGEGLLNTAGATSVNLPADSNGATSITTYDNGQLGMYLLQQIAAIKTRTMQVQMKSKINILSPQRVFTALHYTGIVQLTQFQRDGAGSATIGGLVDDILRTNGDSIEWHVDDTLIGQGAGGTDAIVISIPEVSKPKASINTNEFAALAPGLEATMLQLVDMAAPREIVSPLAQGGTNVISELRATSGWGIRPEAITILSATY